MKARRLYFVGGGGASWRDPRNWSRSPGGPPVKRVHARGDEIVVVHDVEGHDRLDLRGMRFASLSISGYQGRVLTRDGTADFGHRSRLGWLRRKVIERKRPRPRFLRGIDRAIAKYGRWEQSVRDNLATLILTPKGWMVVPVLSGGAAAVLSNGAAARSVSPVAPSFGQNTTAGNLLVATVVANGTANGSFTCSLSGSGWSQAISGVGRANAETSIWYKANCGANETAPTFTYSGGGTLTATLWEVTGCATSSPLDRTNANSGAGTAGTGPSATMTNPAQDVTSGEIVFSANAFSFTSAYTHTSTLTFTSGTPTGNQNNDGSSTTSHYRFAYAIATSNASAQGASISSNKTGTASVCAGSIATFKLATYAVTYSGNGNTGGSAPTDGSSPYIQGATVTVIGNTGGLTRTGYGFKNWNTAADGSGTSYSGGNTFTMPASAVTLYAQWYLAASVTASDTGLTITDSIVTARTHSLSDTGITITDSVATVRTRVLASTGLTVSDSLATVRAHSLADTGLTVSDSIATVRVRPLADTGATITDSTATLRLRLLTDTGLTESDSISLASVVLLTDTGLALSDSVSVSLARPLTDTGLTVTDSIVAAERRSAADTGLTVSDSIVVATLRARAIADTGLVLTDSTQKSATHLLTDTGLAVNDTLSGVLVITLADTGLTVTDSTQKSVVHLVADTGLTVTDSIQRQTREHIQLTDTGLTISDAITTSTIRTRSLTDTALAIFDFIDRTAVSVSITDTGLTVSDSLRIPDFPGFAVGTDVPAYAAASTIVTTDRAEGTDFAADSGAISDQLTDWAEGADFAAYGSTITDRPGGLP